MYAERVRGWVAANWFVPLLILLGLAGFTVARSEAWAVAGGGGVEAALLVDACVTVPLLYFLCYRRQIPSWQMALRLIGIACSGVYLLGYLIPAQGQAILPQFGVARAAGLCVLIAVELWLLATTLRLVFRADTTVDQVRTATGVPPFIAKLMLMEARFWKAVARFFWRR